MQENEKRFPATFSAQDELRAEADFYGLPGLVARLRRLCVEKDNRMTIGKKDTEVSGNKHSAAMWDVQDPDSFSVTFGLTKFSVKHSSCPDWDQQVQCPFFVGVAPVDTIWPSEWTKKSILEPVMLPGHSRRCES